MSPLALSLRFLQTQSDAQLAALARAGHERAFEALVRRYRRPLLIYCRRVGSAGSNSEDTLQQALLQAWSAIRTGVEVRDPRAWLYRIVHNVAVSNQRRPLLVPVEMRDTAGANGADLEAERRMAARDALAGLAALPDLQREVMVGTAVDGMSHEELASALGLSSGAVRGLIYRARATLRAAAAAITPGPVISWALRSGSGPGPGLYEAMAGGGTAGIGGILVKGGAIAATAGAIATATGISTSHKAVHHPTTPDVAAAGPHVVSRPASGASHRVLVVDPTSSHLGSGRGSAAHNPTSESSGRGSDGDGFAATSGEHQSGGRHDGGDRGGSSGTGGQRSGHDGSHSGSGSGSGTGSGTGSGDDGSGSGSGSGGSTSGTGSTTVTSGSGSDDHGGGSGTDGASSSGSGSGSGSSGSGSGDSLSSGGSTLATTVSSVDGGGGGGGSGPDGGTTTTTTTTTTSGDDGSSDSGHPGRH
ncbi:MAG TPA: RNA polymerase sigma factor [Solirubrobacteraceae bacterium]|nr:RNA polymerase sigma factor [Solirubrobacteraceae bacterium]